MSLNMNAHWRSRDAYKASFMNIFALTDLQNKLAQRLSEKMQKEIRVGRYVDITDSFHIYGSYHDEFLREIDRIPQVLLFKKGKLINGFIGVRPESLIREWLEKNLKNDSEKIEDVIKEYEKYAKENRFRLNLDRKKVEFLVKGLLENERKYGVRHCPCRRVTGNLEEDKKKICPCFWHRQEIERDGRCLCGLFVK